MQLAADHSSTQPQLAAISYTLAWYPFKKYMEKLDLQMSKKTKNKSLHLWDAHYVSETFRLISNRTPHNNK